MYHHVVVHLLFAAFRVRQDIHTAVAFLSTHVKAPDDDNWGELKLVMRYLNSTSHVFGEPSFFKSDKTKKVTRSLWKNVT